MPECNSAQTSAFRTWTFAATVLCLSTLAMGQSPKKIALLVGVADYFHKNMEDLQFAENDVNVIGKELKLLGFSVNTLTGRSATKEKVDAAIKSFLKQTESLENNDIVFVMFSGHGQQLMAVQEKKVLVDEKVRTIRQKAETPYFCPRDAVPFNPLKHELTGKSEFEIADELKLVSLNQVIAGLDDQSNSRQNLFVVDACRNNPAKGKTANITGSTTRELPSGLSILFAAESGQKSWESSDSKIKHGVMSHFLIQGLKGKAKNRRDEVTWKRLVAFIAEELEYDAGKLAGASDRKQNPHVIGSSSNLIVLGKRAAPKSLAAPFSKSEIDRARQQWSEYLGVTSRFKTSLGQEMVLIPPGEFTFGNPYTDKELAKMTGEDENAILEELGRWDVKNQRRVNDDFVAGRPASKVRTQAFYMCKTEVSLELFRKFVRETGHVSKAKGDSIEVKDGVWYSSNGAGTGNWRKFGVKLHEESAVRNVDSNDAVEFCKWLSKKTGKSFRLPNDAEWEYVCKSGSKEIWSTYSNLKKIKSYVPKLKSGNHLPSVGAGAENLFGIQDMRFGAAELCSAIQNQNSIQSIRYVRKGGFGPTVQTGSGIWPKFSFTRQHNYVGMNSGFRVVCEVPNQ